MPQRLPLAATPLAQPNPDSRRHGEWDWVARTATRLLTSVPINQPPKIVWLLLPFLLAATACQRNTPSPVSPTAPSVEYSARGVIRELPAAGPRVVIEHDEIPGYMPKMTMPLEVRDTNELRHLRVGDTITFQLTVTADTHWIHTLRKADPTAISSLAPASSASPATAAPSRAELRFTNELGQAVTLGQFRGQALAITFIFTRCPIPDYCPRLSQNFSEALPKLAADRTLPTNWHFLSFTIDPEFDTPAVLRAYAQRHHYDPARWTFLTGTREQITDLAASFGFTLQRNGAQIDHNLRTIIVDVTGAVQMIYPVSGNLTDALVTEMRKALSLPSNTHSTPAPTITP